MNKLYVFREFCLYHIGFYDDKICVASNIDDACKIILKNLDSKYVNDCDGIDIIKQEIKEFDLDVGFKKL